jgi:leader peptidase (prepilin peptidase)/N-methyltransferase
MILLFKIYAFIFGSMVGSFLNVVIYRMPLGKSIVAPRSSCPSCNYQIPWYQNIPIFSFIFLKGKCANCGVKISYRYPIIELIIGAASVLLFPNYLSPTSLFEYFFLFSIFCALVCHFVIDLDHQLLLDKINLYLLFLFLPYSLFFNHYTFWAIGGAIGFGFPWLITEIYFRLRGKVGLGGGDIKLWGVLGIFLGPKMIVMNIFLSCFLGSIIGGILMILKKFSKDNYLAFGPFIIIVVFFQIYFPELMTELNNLLFSN